MSVARWLVYVDGRYRSYTTSGTRMRLTLTPGLHALGVVAAYADGTRSTMATIQATIPGAAL